MPGLPTAGAAEQPSHNPAPNLAPGTCCHAGCTCEHPLRRAARCDSAYMIQEGPCGSGSGQDCTALSAQEAPARGAQQGAQPPAAAIGGAGPAGSDQQALQAEVERLNRLLQLSHKAVEAATAGEQRAVAAGRARAEQMAAALSAAEGLREAAELARHAAEQERVGQARRLQQLEEQVERQRSVIAMLANSRGTAFEERYHLQVRCKLTQLPIWFIGTRP